MQKIKKAILWDLEDLLGWGVEFFLGSKQGWDVVNISESEGIGALIWEVKRQSPDVVIFCKNDCETDAALLFQLFRNCPGIKVLIVNRDDNSIEIFKKQQIWLKEVTDLASAVDS